MSGPARNAVHGCPSSLLNDPGGATVGPSRTVSWAIRSFVVVLPDEPVSPITVSSGSRSTTARASRPIASRASATSTIGTPGTSRVPSTATAPASTAAAA